MGPDGGDHLQRLRQRVQRVPRRDWRGVQLGQRVGQHPGARAAARDELEPQRHPRVETVFLRRCLPAPRDALGADGDHVRELPARVLREARRRGGEGGDGRHRQEAREAAHAVQPPRVAGAERSAARLGGADSDLARRSGRRLEPGRRHARRVPHRAAHVTARGYLRGVHGDGITDEPALHRRQHREGRHRSAEDRRYREERRGVRGGDARGAVRLHVRVQRVGVRGEAHQNFGLSVKDIVYKKAHVKRGSRVCHHSQTNLHQLISRRAGGSFAPAPLAVPSGAPAPQPAASPLTPAPASSAPPTRPP